MRNNLIYCGSKRLSNAHLKRKITQEHCAKECPTSLKVKVHTLNAHCKRALLLVDFEECIASTLGTFQYPRMYLRAAAACFSK